MFDIDCRPKAEKILPDAGGFLAPRGTLHPDSRRPVGCCEPQGIRKFAARPNFFQGGSTPFRKKSVNFFSSLYLKIEKKVKNNFDPIFFNEACPLQKKILRVRLNLSDFYIPPLAGTSKSQTDIECYFLMKLLLCPY